MDKRSPTNPISEQEIYSIILTQSILKLRADVVVNCFLRTMIRFFILSILLFLVSCQGETTTLRNIENRSDKDLKMLIYRFGVASGDTLHVDAGQTKRISLTTSDTAQEEAPACVERIDSAYTEVVGGGTLTKKIQFDSNWTSETEASDGLPQDYSHTCTFVIRNSDIAD